MEHQELCFAGLSVESLITERAFEAKTDGLYEFSKEDILHLVNIDIDSGTMEWSKNREPCEFKSYRTFRAYMGQRAGKIAGSERPNGYRVIKLFGKYFREHRVIFYIRYGWLPEQVDHINGIRDDNRIVNLRPSDSKRNSHNSKLNSNNKVGYKGVAYCEKRGVFRAQIYTSGKQKFLGYFSSAHNAHKAYVSAAKQMFGNFHSDGS